MGVEASIIVEFGDGADEDSGTVVELDDKHPNNLTTDDDGNVSMKSFAPGDEPVFLIFTPSTIQIDRVACTDGSVSRLDVGINRDRKLNSLFTGTDTVVTPSYSEYVLGGAKWFGNSATLEVGEDGIVARTGEFPCYGEVSISVQFAEQWKLTPPSLNLKENESYTIYVVVYVSRRTP